jgi:predicted nucleic acid-binding Zn ribbon protein
VSTPTCPVCGAQVGPTDDFCGNCGNYLGWGAKAARDDQAGGDAGSAAAEAAARADRAAALIAPIVDRPPATPATPATSGDRPTPNDPAARSGQAGQRDSAGPAGPAARGGPAGFGEVATPADPGDLGPVLPGRPEARRPLPSTAAAADSVVGPPCPVCGTPNPPERRFCRRCATPLHPEEHAPAAVRRRRWRWRGDRTRWLRRLAVLAVTVALVVAGIVFWPRLTGLWEDLRDRLATPSPVGPVSTTASAAVPGHPAVAAVDGLSNRYWGAPAVGDSIDFTFATPFRLLSVVVHAGASAEEEGFATEARPTALDMIVTTEDGTTRSVPVTLADQPGEQRTDTGISDVTEVRLVIRGAAGLVPGRHIALGEVEFFRRS